MKSLYFTQAELEVMLELSGGAGHTLYRVGAPPDDAALIKAFVSLYQRGFLARKEGALAPTPKGAFFRDMSRAPLAIALTVRYPRNVTALCYGGGETVWVCENVFTMLSEQVRLSQVPTARLEGWMFETKILLPPVLTEQDGEELSQMWQGETNPDSVRLRIEQYRNGGALLRICEALNGNGLPLIRIREGERETVSLYTLEALRSMLARCFRKDGHQAL